jgi:hypothetical protein
MSSSPVLFTWEQPDYNKRERDDVIERGREGGRKKNSKLWGDE